MWEQAKAQSPHHEPMVHTPRQTRCCPRRFTTWKQAKAQSPHHEPMVHTPRQTRCCPRRFTRWKQAKAQSPRHQPMVHTPRHTRCWDTALDNGESCCRRSQPGSRKRRAHRLSARASRPLVETALVGAREPQRRAHRLSVRASWPPVVTARSGTEQHRGSSARLVVTQRPCVWSREATWAFASLVCTYEPDVSCESGPVYPGPGRRL